MSVVNMQLQPASRFEITWTLIHSTEVQMNLHDQFLVFNLNIIIALTILVVAVTVFILYCEQREKEKSRPQEIHSFEKMMFENVRNNRLRRDELKKAGKTDFGVKKKLRTYVARLMKCR